MENRPRRLTPNQRTLFETAFDRACAELGLGQLSLDVAKREYIAQLIVDIVSRGEQDIDAVQRRAVFGFRIAPWPSSSPGCRDAS